MCLCDCCFQLPTLRSLDAKASDNVWVIANTIKISRNIRNHLEPFTDIYSMCLRWTLMCGCETRAREREREREKAVQTRHIYQQFVCQVLTKSNHFSVWGILFSFILLQSRLRRVTHPCCPPGHSCANAREVPSSACQI